MSEPWFLLSPSKISVAPRTEQEIREHEIEYDKYEEIEGLLSRTFYGCKDLEEKENFLLWIEKQLKQWNK